MSDGAEPPALLLDTCAMIWLANGNRLLEPAVAAIVAAAESRQLYVSVASAWEIGMLSQQRPIGHPRLDFQPDPKSWFIKFVSGHGIQQADITYEIAIDASHLPGDMHGDPGDRLIVATARYLSATIVTRDRKIISYAGSGYVNVLPC